VFILPHVAKAMLWLFDL